MAGRSLLEHLVERLRLAASPDQIILATTTHPQDEAIVEEARRLGVSAFQGSQEDVLARYYFAALEAHADLVVRVTGDCPLLDPVELDRVVDCFLAHQESVDFVRNQEGHTRKIPHGHDVEVFPMRLLEEAWRKADQAGDREHVTPWFYRTPGRYRTMVTDPDGPDYSHLRLTVDTPEDLQLLQALVDHVGTNPSLVEIDSFLSENKEIADLNAHVQQRGIASEEERRRVRVAGKTLVARADAGAGIGYGHVARQEALLDAWVELGGRAVLVGKGIGGSVRQRLLAANVEIIDVEGEVEVGASPEAVAVPSAQALEAFLALAREQKADALSLDGYGFREGYVTACAEYKPTVFIDDLAAFPIFADVVVNQNMNFPASRYTVGPDSACLVGHPYILFRREFRQVLESKPSTHKGRRILATFGGSDPARLTLPVVQALLPQLAPEDEIWAVVGQGLAVEDAEALRVLAQSGEGSARLGILVDIVSMSSIMAQVDLAVSAAGSTTWELLLCGVPTLVIPVAENQRAVARGVAERGAARNLGWHQEVSPAQIAAEVVSLLEDPAQRATLRDAGRALIDGRGVWRVIDALCEVMNVR